MRQIHLSLKNIKESLLAGIYRKWMDERDRISSMGGQV